MPKISILLAVYNGSKTLRDTIGCLQNQTLKDIEIICVDDYSTDNSVEIIRELQAGDNRIKLVTSPENMGTVHTRKAGVDNASGDYIMFMDQDDKFEEYAFEEVYDMIVEKNVDILEFRSRVVAVPPTTEKRRKWQEDFMRPYDGFLYGKDVFNYCFAPNSRENRTWNYYTWFLWHKIYRSDVCKKAMEYCDAGYTVLGDDVYIYMLISYFAESYYGDANGKFYHIYYLGSGFTGEHTLNLKSYYTLIRRVTCLDKEKKFLLSFSEKENEDALILDRCRALCGIVQRWYLRVEPASYADGFDMMCQYIAPDQLIAAFEKDLKASDEQLYNAVKDSVEAQITHKYIKILCIYVGAADKSEQLIDRETITGWRRNGYKIICLAESDTDLTAAGYDDIETYRLPERGKEIRFFEYPLAERTAFLKNFINDKHIDGYVYSGKKQHEYIYDLLLVKCTGAQFFTYAAEYPELEGNAAGLKKYKSSVECSDGILLPPGIRGSIPENEKYARAGNYEKLFVRASDPSLSMAGQELRKKLEKQNEVIISVTGDAEFRKMCGKLALRRKFKNSDLKGKIKIVIKKMLRLAGIRKNYYCDEYDSCLELEKLLNKKG